MEARREPERRRKWPNARPFARLWAGGRADRSPASAHRIRITRDPVAVVREIIEASDGVERSVVLMLAEDEGLSPRTTGATIDRLVRDGRLRSERTPDGEEVYAWETHPLVP